MASHTTGSNEKTNWGALTVLTSLFFIWGFITCLNDILIPHLKAVLLQLADEEIMSSYIKERETPSTSHDFISLMSLSFRSTWSVYRDIEQRLNADKR